MSNGNRAYRPLKLSKMELIGLFWLPDHEENRVAGLLRFSDHETSILETDQAFQDNPKEFPFIGRIIGKCSNTNITLDNCSYKSRCIGSNSLIRCNFTFIGDHYVNSEDITLRQLTFSINGLNEWLNLNGFNTNKSIKTLDDDHLLIEYRMPKPIHVPISDDLSLNFFFGYESDSLSNSRTIRQIPRIEITSQKDISFHEFLNL